MRLSGESLPFRIADGQEMLARARVFGTDIEAGNGVLHAIDRVLIEQP